MGHEYKGNHSVKARVVKDNDKYISVSGIWFVVGV